MIIMVCYDYEESTGRVLITAKSQAEAFDAGIPCRTHLSMRGLDAGEELVLYAREHKVDTLVIGLKKRSRMDKMLFGSTAQYILLNARVPIVSVPLFF